MTFTEKDKVSFNIQEKNKQKHLSIKIKHVYLYKNLNF